VPATLIASEARPSLLLVLAGLQDPGNLGTILRSAEAFGATGVIALPGTVSAWNQKAVRASAGSLFRLPLIASTAEEAFPRLREAGLRIFTTAVEGAQAAPLADLTQPVAVLIGNEGNGVAAEIAAQADAALTIPCPGPVESLNASIAASILLYEASRQRSCAEGERAGVAGGRCGASYRTGAKQSVELRQR
jgi:TrmH family RNA methyltransferase